MYWYCSVHITISNVHHITKCNIITSAKYSNISKYLRAIYWRPSNYYYSIGCFNVPLILFLISLFECFYCPFLLPTYFFFITKQLEIDQYLWSSKEKSGYTNLQNRNKNSGLQKNQRISIKEKEKLMQNNPLYQ